MDERDEDELETSRREKEAIAKGKRYVRLRFSAENALVALTPDAFGLVAIRKHHGEPFDPRHARVVPGGWDHEHCLICGEHVYPGDEWWAMLPPDECGLCLACYARLLGAGRG
jgi:hypothetical protein